MASRVPGLAEGKVRVTRAETSPFPAPIGVEDGKVGFAAPSRTVPDIVVRRVVDLGIERVGVLLVGPAVRTGVGRIVVNFDKDGMGDGPVELIVGSDFSFGSIVVLFEFALRLAATGE